MTQWLLGGGLPSSIVSNCKLLTLCSHILPKLLLPSNGLMCTQRCQPLGLAAPEPITQCKACYRINLCCVVFFKVPVAVWAQRVSPVVIQEAAMQPACFNRSE